MTVTPDTFYSFSAQAANIYGDNPATLDFDANSALLGPTFTVGAAGTTGDWNTFNATWYSGSSTSVVLTIVDTNTIASGNDFGVDNIALSAPEPSTWAMMILESRGSALRAPAARRPSPSLPTPERRENLKGRQTNGGPSSPDSSD